MKKITERTIEKVFLEEWVKNFKSVRIIHDIIHRADYSYLAEFFRFMGVLVCENILPEAIAEDNMGRRSAESDTEYNVSIYVGEKDLAEDEAIELGISVEQYAKLMLSLPEQTVFLYNDLIIMQSLENETEKNADVFLRKVIGNFSLEMQKNVVYELLAVIFEKEYANMGKIIADQLRELIDIYVENALWRHSMNLQYYRKRRSSVAEEAKAAFLASHNAVKDCMYKKSESLVAHWYQYAWLWCEWKVDTACDYLHDVLYFSVDNLSDRCEMLSMEYPGFSNVKVLLGLSYETVPNRTNDALAAFKDALKDIGKECFAAPVYYWMGRRYEAYSDMKDCAKRCYQQADQSKPKFRTNFKLAMFAMDEEDYDEGIRLLDKIIKGLDLKLKMKFADPLELEYLFKSYVQQCYAFNKSGRNEEAVRVAEKAEQIREKSIDENHYFDVFYGDEADSYRELLRDRMKSKVLEWLKIDSSRK